MASRCRRRRQKPGRDEFERLCHAPERPLLPECLQIGRREARLQTLQKLFVEPPLRGLNGQILSLALGNDEADELCSFLQPSFQGT